MNRVTESHAPHGFSIAASGDFTGRGEWTLAQDGPEAVVHYDWRISADRPLLRYGSPILKPLFVSNHRWAMDRAEEGIRLELARRHATTTEERAAVPLPTRPAVNVPTPYLVGGIAPLGIAFILWRRSRKTD